MSATYVLREIVKTALSRNPALSQPYIDQRVEKTVDPIDLLALDTGNLFRVCDVQDCSRAQLDAYLRITQAIWNGSTVGPSPVPGLAAYGEPEPELEPCRACGQQAVTSREVGQGTTTVMRERYERDEDTGEPLELPPVAVEAVTEIIVE